MYRNRFFSRLASPTTIFSLLTACMLLAGCVTEQSYQGSKKPYTQREVEPVKAAKNRLALAMNYIQSGDYAQARFNLATALEFAPELAEVHSGFAYYFQTVGETKQAETYYQQALAIAPKDGDILNNYGVFLCRNGQFENAEQQFLTAVTITEYIRVAESYENASFCAVKNDDFTKAERFLMQALQHSPERFSSLVSYAELMYAMGQYLKSRKALKQISRSGHVSADMTLLTYLNELKTGNLNKANDAANLLVTMYPNSMETGLYQANRLAESRFEQLRKRFLVVQKQHVLADDMMPVNGKRPDIKIKYKKPKKDS